MTASPHLGPLPAAPRFSVISTVYQHEAFLERALASVLSQDWPADQLEYIVVNDGSTDASRDILDRYAAEYPRMRVIHQDNGGLKAAINTALSAVSGDLVRAVSGDDMLAPGALARAAEHLQARPNVGLLYSDMTVIDRDDNPVERSFMRSTGNEPFIGRPLGQLLSANFVSGGSVTLRTKLLPMIHPLPEAAAWEDYWWAWRVAQIADLDYLDEPTYLYREHGSNMSYGAGDTQRIAGYVDELRFRRHMLSTVEPGQVSARWAMRGWGQLLRMAGIVAEQSRRPIYQVLAVTDTQRQEAEIEAARAMRAASAGDTDLAATYCVRALGRDPQRDDVRALSRGLHTAAKADTDPQLLPLALGDLRRFVTVADADVVVATPDLLAMYGATMSADDDATLMLHAPGWDGERIQRELMPALAAAGMAGDASPDITAHTGPATDWARLVGRAHGRLAENRATAHPAFGSQDSVTLRTAAERVWARPAPVLFA